MKNALKLLLFSGLCLSLAGCPAKNTNSLTPLVASTLAAPPDTVTIIMQNYKPQPGNTYQNFFVSNFSVGVSNGQLTYMTARDGLPDPNKIVLGNSYNFSITSPESAVTGFQDLVLSLAGLNVARQKTLSCPATLQNSTTGDLFTYNDGRYPGSPLTTLGLRDCVKQYMGLNPKSFDSNNNGIPDYLELRCGMNPSIAIQSSLSPAVDGLTNLEKCRRHLPIDESATTQPNTMFAYSYSNANNPDGSIMFTVANIPILKGGQDNFIAFYVVEKNLSTNASSLYTAFAILKEGYANQILKFPYWATSQATFLNQQILVP